MTDKPDDVSSAPVECAIRKVAIGYVSYNITVNCPNCEKEISLNKYPYNDEETEFSLTDNELGLALFGTNTKPATWANLDIHCQCCKCRKPVILNSIEI